MKTNPNDSISAPSMAVSPDGHLYSSYECYVENGLTKREWLTGLAMQGNFDPQGCEDRIAKLCVRMADALIKELNKEQTNE